MDSINPEIIFSLLVVPFVGWILKRSLQKDLKSLDAVPGLVVSLEKIAEYLKDAKVKIEQISIIEKEQKTMWLRINELQVALIEKEKMSNATEELLRKRVHELSNAIANIQGKLELHLNGKGN